MALKDGKHFVMSCQTNDFKNLWFFFFSKEFYNMRDIKKIKQKKFPTYAICIEVLANWDFAKYFSKCFHTIGNRLCSLTVLRIWCNKICYANKITKKKKKTSNSRPNEHLSRNEAERNVLNSEAKCVWPVKLNNF